MTTASNGNGSGARGGQFPQREHGRTNGLAPNPPQKGLTVLITGGAGYIGTVLTGRLLERGYNVRLLDRLYWGEGPLEAYAGRIDVEVADVRDIPGSALDGVDGVIHLARVVERSDRGVRPGRELADERGSHRGPRQRVRRARDRADRIRVLLLAVRRPPGRNA